MNIDDFIKKWEGKICDFDGAFGGQCFDLYRQYCQDVLQVPQSPPVGNQGAKLIWDNYLKDYFDKYENSPTGVPQKGDIVIWGNGTYGHVAIFIEGNTMRFTSFDQNFPDGSLCAKVTHSYSGVLGWLRKKVVSVSPSPQNPVKIDLTGFKTVLEEYGVMEIETLKSKLLAKDIDLVNKQEIIEVQDVRIDELEKIANGLLDIKIKALEIAEDKWTWVGVRGWKNQLAKLKVLLG